MLLWMYCLWQGYTLLIQRKITEKDDLNKSKQRVTSEVKGWLLFSDFEAMASSDIKLLDGIWKTNFSHGIKWHEERIITLNNAWFLIVWIKDVACTVFNTTTLQTE